MVQRKIRSNMLEKICAVLDCQLGDLLVVSKEAGEINTPA
jgi:DNA-binding Xre family transcriptional regulator